MAVSFNNSNKIIQNCKEHFVKCIDNNYQNLIYINSRPLNLKS